jgi:hypothetical protein
MIEKETRLPITPLPVEEQTRLLSDTIPAPIPSTEPARPSVERRAFARRKAKGKVTFQIGDWGMGPTHKAEVVDISQNGIGLLMDRLLPQGTKLRILRETPYRGQKVTVPAQVRWVAGVGVNQFRVGCSLEKRLQYTEMQAFT